MIRMDKRPKQRVKYFKMSNMTESIETGDLRLDGLDSGIDLIELFKFEQTIANWAFKENHENHRLYC